MRNVLKKFGLQLSVLVIINVIVVMLLVIPSHYDITTPAVLTDIRETFDFEGYDETDVNVKTVSVCCYYNVSLLSYFTSFLNPYAIREKNDVNVITDLEYQYASGTIQKETSMTQSMLAGGLRAGIDIDYKFNGYVIHSLYGKTKSLFEIGDIIISTLGVKVTETLNPPLILRQVCGTINKDNALYIDLKLDQTYNFEVIRDGEVISLNVSPFSYQVDDNEYITLGISMYHSYTINNTSVKYTINNPDTLGPSGGLMQSLFIYDTLSKSNLTKGLNVSGTGTIDQDGNVGAIGGIGAKIIAAHLDGVDVFFIPSSNKEEALTYYNKLKTKMVVYVVNTLDDCIDYLQNYGGNK